MVRSFVFLFIFVIVLGVSTEGEAQSAKGNCRSLTPIPEEEQPLYERLCALEQHRQSPLVAYIGLGNDAVYGWLSNNDMTLIEYQYENTEEDFSLKYSFAVLGDNNTETSFYGLSVYRGDKQKSSTTHGALGTEIIHLSHYDLGVVETYKIFSEEPTIEQVEEIVQEILQKKLSPVMSIRLPATHEELIKGALHKHPLWKDWNARIDFIHMASGVAFRSNFDQFQRIKGVMFGLQGETYEATYDHALYKGLVLSKIIATANSSLSLEDATESSFQQFRGAVGKSISLEADVISVEVENRHNISGNKVSIVAPSKNGEEWNIKYDMYVFKLGDVLVEIFVIQPALMVVDHESLISRVLSSVKDDPS